MRALVLGVLAAVVLSGCAVEPPTLEGLRPGDGNATGAPPLPGTTGPPGGPGNATDDNATYALPAEWHVGQWWKYRLSGDRATSAEDTRVVTADAGASYVVGTSNADVAYFDALGDVSTLGPIRKADLAGSQRGQYIEMFRWPLVANATWTTTWDGQPRTVTVLGPQVTLVAGKSLPTMQLVASDASGIRARYAYAPAAGWFAFMEFFDANGNFRLDLTDFGGTYNGTVADVKVASLYRDEAGGNLKPQGAFTVPGGLSFLDASMLLQGDQVGYSLTFTPPNNTALGPYNVGPCSQNCTERLGLRMEPLPGSWSVVALGAVNGGQAHAAFEVRGVEVRERTVR